MYYYKLQVLVLTADTALTDTVKNWNRWQALNMKYCADRILMWL